ncbi:MAG: hypothetical protein ACTHK4_07280 [Mycobacteriales bacterium]
MRSTRLPRLLAMAAVGFVLLPAPILLSAAHAASSKTVTVPLNQASWYWRAQVGVIGSTGVAPPQQVPNPSVPAGDLDVAGPEAPAAAGTPAGPVAETYLSYDMSSVPVGSTITSFVISLPVDSGGVNANASAASMVACLPKAAWSGGESAAAYGGKPADACDVHSPKVAAADGGKRYTVDIAAIAQQWLKPNALNLGVAIRDNPANTSTAYQVVFGPASSLTHVTASVTYVPPGQGAGPIVAPGGSTAVPPPPSASAPSVPVPPVATVPVPTGQPAQVATPPAPVVAPTAPAVALAAKPADRSTPPLGFWVGLVLIALLLATTTFVLADPQVNPTLTPDRGVARALRTRLMLTHR